MVQNSSKRAETSQYKLKCDHKSPRVAKLGQNKIITSQNWPKQIKTKSDLKKGHKSTKQDHNRLKLTKTGKTRSFRPNNQNGPKGPKLCQNRPEMSKIDQYDITTAQMGHTGPKMIQNDPTWGKTVHNSPKRSK
jgi:hypothetical protein